MPAKSAGLHVYNGSPLAIAVAAIRASYARAVGFLPEPRRDAATRPKARAALASNGSGSKSASACCRCDCRAARSSSVDATNGPTANSARVTALIRASAGSGDDGERRPKRMTVDVSSMPCGTSTLTALDPEQSQYRCATAPHQLSARTPSGRSVRSPGQPGGVVAVARRRASRRA